MSTEAARRPGDRARKIEFGPRLVDCLAEGYVAPHTSLRGRAASAIFRPGRSDVWCVEGRLSAGAELGWNDVHGEEVLHVLDGTIECLGHVCRVGTSVIVEAGIPASITAASDARVLHFGAGLEPPAGGPFGAPRGEQRAVRIVGPRGLAEYVEPGRVARYWADGSSDTCRVTLFASSRAGAAHQAPHSHSVDEIFMITEGEIIVGRRRIGEGMVVFVSGNTRYAFRGGDDGYMMINYRPDASFYMLPGVDERPIEGVRWPGITWVGDVVA